jgi:hypothetical protein
MPEHFLTNSLTEQKHMPNLTIPEWAKTVGISRQQGYEAVKRCEIPVTDKLVDVDVATMLYQRRTRQRANGSRPEPIASPPGAPPSPPSAGASYDSSRARREAAEATLSEMKLAEMAGGLVSKEGVDTKVFEIVRALRDGLMNCARRMAADVAGLSDADECEVVIEREHRQLLASLAHAFKSEMSVSVGDAQE